MAELKTSARLSYRIEFLVVKGILACLEVLPFRQRRQLMGWIMVHVIGPVTGFRKRIFSNLTFVWPDLALEKRHSLSKDCARYIGQTVCELLSPQDLVRMAKQTDLTGPGLEALEEARKNNRPAVIVSGHFGNYDIVRAGLIAHGFNVGALYRRMNNPYFNTLYYDKISQVGTPLFERGRPGLSHMLKHLKHGGTLAALIDVRARDGEYMPFLGHPARTSTSMAELALRYDAILVPFFGTRLPGDEGFIAEFEEPIPHSDPSTMTKALNAALEARVQKNPEQWFWVHNRWKDADR